METFKKLAEELAALAPDQRAELLAIIDGDERAPEPPKVHVYEPLPSQGTARKVSVRVIRGAVQGTGT